MATKEPEQNVFGKFAGKVDSFFEKRFYKIGTFVGTRPLTSLGLSFLFALICCGGFSQLKSESRADKLWIPQGTQAQSDEAEYTKHFPPGSRFANILLEAKTGSATDKAFLVDAMKLHSKIEEVSFEDKTLVDVCIMQPGNGHPCFINSILSAWNYDEATLVADPDPLATLNSAMSQENLQRMLGTPTVANNEVTGAKAITIMYLLQLNRTLDGGDYADPTGEGWEEKLLEVLGCDDPDCSGDQCMCTYKSENDKFFVHPLATRSWSDAFGEVIRGDVGLINGAFMIMIIYLILNLGGLCHKVNSRALLAFMCVLTIVFSGAAGYGMAMWFQFDYSPVHSVLPFVILGIGVDDSFVIMNALDRTDKSKPVVERIAQAISHAGVSIMVTSVTDFVAFAISVSSALPALSSFCMYAAFSVLFLFAFQLTMFTPLASLDLRRVVANRIDCCFCLPRGWFCCPVAPQEESARAIENGTKDPNQLCCCTEPKHQGGRIGFGLERGLGPQLVKKPLAGGLIAVFSGFCGLCAWQASELSVQDTQRSFIPDDSYVLAAIDKNDALFADLGTRAHLMTLEGDYFASQKALVDLAPALDDTGYAAPTSSDSYSNWAADFRAFCEDNAALCAQLPRDAEGYATNEVAYYAGLKVWLSDGPGAKHAADVVWVDESDSSKGIKASKIAFEIKSVKKIVNDKAVPDADHATDAMDSLRSMCDAQTGLPGGKCIAYTADFLSWETFKIIKYELFLSTGLCLLAVFVITLALIAHPLTALLVFGCVVMTIVDILGCMNMWGLAIDSVSVIQLVIAVGLSVDYSAHIGHNFMVQTGTREERTIKTLGDVGSAVLCGGLSTFLGVMLLALSKSYVFRVLFQCFFLTVVLGLAHGMILLPALLSLIGPASYRTKGTEEVEVVKPEGNKVQVGGTQEA